MTTRPPTGLGSRRALPRGLDAEQRERLRALLTDPDHWVLRPDWQRYLANGDESLLHPIARLSRDHRVSVIAWLDQQRHALHRILDGGDIAPEGWLETLPLYRRLLEDPRG